MSLVIIDKKFFIILKKDLWEGKMLIEYLHNTVFKKNTEKCSKSRNNRRKAEKSLKNRIFLLKAEEVVALVDVVDDLLLNLLDDILLDD